MATFQPSNLLFVAATLGTGGVVPKAAGNQ